MSQRGRGSGPFGDDPDGEDVGAESARADYPLPPTASRPIAPYDPYRPSSGDAPRVSRRNVAAESFEPPSRPSSYDAGDDPFLPADDPLSSEAWQLELDDATVLDDDLAAPHRERDPDAPRPPPRRARRQPSSTRTHRESSSADRAPRRSRSAPARGRAPRPTITLGAPQVVAGSSLVADQTMLALLGINAASILVMALLLGVRLGGIPSPVVLQLDAAGNPDLWGTPSVLWRLPVMAFFLTVMFLVVAWFVHPIDRFAARFALAAAIVAQVIAWVAIIQHLA